MQSGDISLFEIQIQLDLLYCIRQAPALAVSSFPGTRALYGSGVSLCALASLPPLHLCLRASGASLLPDGSLTGLYGPVLWVPVFPPSLSVQLRMGPRTVPGVPCPPWPRLSPSQPPLLVGEGGMSGSCGDSRSHPARFSGVRGTCKATRKMRGGAEERLEGASPLPPGKAQGEGEGPCIQLEVHTPERSPEHSGHPRTGRTRRGAGVSVWPSLTA